MSGFYNTLLELRYPGMTRVEQRDIQTTLLTGESRVSLLTWLLAEKSTAIADELKKLQGPELEEKLVTFYSQIGICSKKNILLGNCSLEEQLPALRLILEFIQTVHVESPVEETVSRETVNDILQMYITENADVTPLHNINPKVSFAEAKKYFEDLQRKIEEAESTENETSIAVESESVTCTNKDEKRSTDCDSADVETSFLPTIQKFIETFSSSIPQSVSHEGFVKNASNCMDKDIDRLYTNLIALKEALQLKDEISKIEIPTEFHYTNTPLSEIVQNIVISTEEYERESMHNEPYDSD